VHSYGRNIELCITQTVLDLPSPNKKKQLGDG
jgi:hypothetical protein